MRDSFKTREEAERHKGEIEKKFTKSKLGRAVTEFKLKSKFAKNWSCSDFRHSFSVHFLTKGGSLNKLQYLLGHSHVHQTKQLYGNVTKQFWPKVHRILIPPPTLRIRGKNHLRPLIRAAFLAVFLDF